MNRKSIIASAAFLVIAFAAICGIVNLTGAAKKDWYRGTAEGRNGPVTLEMKIIDGKILDGRVVSEQETDFAKPALKEMISQAKKAGNADNFDAVSGATISSDAAALAIRNAVALSNGETISETKYEDTECDIVVIGAGGAGLTAAIEANARGAKVIVLEKMGIAGGNTNSATGGLNASETSIQKAKGIADSNEQYFKDTMKGGYNLNDPDLVHFMTDNSAKIVDWLISLGADLTDVGKMAGSTNSRTHRPQGGAPVGKHLVDVLLQNVEKNGIDLRLKNKVTGIIAEDGKPCAVEVQTSSGKYKISAKAFIVATGGFGANPEMVIRYVPSLKGFGTTNHKGATGDAFAWLDQFGAETIDMELIQTHPTVVPGSGVMITEAVRGNGAIIVNRDGKRFCSEMSTRDVMSKAILQQKGETAYLMFDQGVRESLKAIEGYVKQGLLTEAPTLAELAKKLNLPEAELEATFAEYNRAQKAGEDSMGRKISEMPRALETAPFYAVEIGPAIHHTMGGLKINTKAEVLNKRGKSIPGLYACGEVTGGIHGGNRLGGNAVADIEIFGKQAADSACDYLGL